MNKTSMIIGLAVVTLVVAVVLLVGHFAFGWFKSSKRAPGPSPGPSKPSCTPSTGGSSGTHQLCATDTSSPEGLLLDCKLADGVIIGSVPCNNAACIEPLKQGQRFSKQCQPKSTLSPDFMRPTPNSAIFVLPPHYRRDTHLVYQTHWYIGFISPDAKLLNSDKMQFPEVGTFKDFDGKAICVSNFSWYPTSQPGDVCFPQYAQYVSTQAMCRTISTNPQEQQIGTFSPTQVNNLGNISILAWHFEGNIQEQNHALLCDGCKKGALCSDGSCQNTCTNGNTETKWWRLSGGAKGHIQVQYTKKYTKKEGCTKPPSKLILQLNGVQKEIDLFDAQNDGQQCWFTYNSPSYTYNAAKKWLGKTVDVDIKKK